MAKGDRRGHFSGHDHGDVKRGASRGDRRGLVKASRGEAAQKDAAYLGLAQRVAGGGNLDLPEKRPSGRGAALARLGRRLVEDGAEPRPGAGRSPGAALRKGDPE